MPVSSSTGPQPAGPLRIQAGVLPNITAGGCVYYPNALSTQSFLCPDDNNGLQYAYVGAPIRLNLTVADDDGSVMNVTVWWDVHLNFSASPVFVPEPTNASAVQYFDVTPPGPAQAAQVEALWAYPELSSDPNQTIVQGQSAYYLVFVNVTNANGYSPFRMPPGCAPLPYGNCFFKIAVALNSFPNLDGLQTNYTFAVGFPDPVIPPLSLAVSVLDQDNDPVTVTWAWGDGTITVNATGPAGQRRFLNLSHAYTFGLNQTPQNFVFHLAVSIDDGIPTHNTTSDIQVLYYLGYDRMPDLVIQSPKAGSPWEINTTVPIQGALLDFEADLLTYYWDFGDGNGTAWATSYNATVRTAHAYTVSGAYNITLWATDGLDKRLCMGTDCTKTHWVNLSQPISVHANRAPLVSLTISSDPGVYGKPAGFAVAARDSDWDNLTVTWSFGDGTWAVNQTEGSPNTLQFLQIHNYTHWGAPPNYTYEVTAWVDDGHGHNVTQTTEVFIGSQNMPPVLSASLELANDSVHLGQTFYLNVTVRDAEGDPVWIEVDYGDGNVDRGNVTLQPRTNHTVPFEHAYFKARNYTINITITDRMIWVRLNRTSGELVTLPHNVTAFAVVNVLIPPLPTLPDNWTWVDYTTLAAVLALPGAGLARSAYRRYQERKED